MGQGQFFVIQFKASDVSGYPAKSPIIAKLFARLTQHLHADANTTKWRFSLKDNILKNRLKSSITEIFKCLAYGADAGKQNAVRLELCERRSIRYDIRCRTNPCHGIRN